MDAVPGPGKAEQLQNLDKLLKMQGLLCAYHVERLHKMKGALPVLRRCQVPGQVEGGSVFLAQHGRRKAEFLKVHNKSALAFDSHPFFLHQPDGVVEQIIVMTLAVVIIKFYTQKVVDLIIIFQAEAAEKFPEINGLFLPIFEALEPVAGLFIQRGICIGFLVEAYIEVVEIIDGILMQLFTVAPAFKRYNHLPKLGAPIPQMIDAQATISLGLKDQGEGVPYDSGADMPDPEGFADIGRGIVYDNNPSPAYTGSAILRSFIVYSFEQITAKNRIIKIKIQVRPFSGSLLPEYSPLAGKGCAQFCGNCRRGFLLPGGQAKAGKGQIAEFRVRWLFQKLCHPEFIKHDQRRQNPANFFFVVIHFRPPRFCILSYFSPNAVK